MHTDDMNDLVLMGLARDSAEAEVKRLRGMADLLGEAAQLLECCAHELAKAQDAYNVISDSESMATVYGLSRKCEALVERIDTDKEQG